MIIWEILEIDYTEDISTIKKAYAKKLKICHPEDDAQGYQKLREAYDKAVKIAKAAGKIRETQDSYEDDAGSEGLEQTESTDNQAVQLPKINYYDELNYTRISFENRLTKFLEQLESIYIDFSSRININAWVEILNHDVMWEIDKKQNLFSNIVEFLSDHRFLPREIWVLLDDAFQLQIRLEDPVFKEFNSLRNYLLRVFKQRSMTFEFLFNIEYEAREKFIEYRVLALDCLESKDYSLTYAYIDDAKEIFEEDPELICLDGTYLSVSNRFDEAVKAFSKVLDAMPNSEEALLGRANIYLRNDDFSRAKTDFEALTLLRPNDNELTAKLARIYLKLNDPIGARSLFKKIDAYDPNRDDSYVTELLQTNKALIKMSKNSDSRSSNYFQEELPHIKAELKKLEKYKSIHEKGTSNNLYSHYLIFITGIALVLVLLSIANVFYKPSAKEHTPVEKNIIETKNSVTSLNSDEAAETEVTGLSAADLERLWKTGEKISITLTDPQVLNFIIHKTTNGNNIEEILIPTNGNEVINSEYNNMLKLLSNIYIGRSGKSTLFFYGNILSLLKDKSDAQSTMVNLPSKITLEGIIVKNNIVDFKSQVTNDLSNFEGYRTNIDSVNTDYILKVDDFTVIEN